MDRRKVGSLAAMPGCFWRRCAGQLATAFSDTATAEFLVGGGFGNFGFEGFAALLGFEGRGA